MRSALKPTSRGGLYHYFSNKDELIKAVIQYAAENALSIVHEAAATEPDPRSALRRMGAFFLQAFYEPDFESVARLDLETWSEALRNPGLLKIIHEGRGATRDSIAEVIREGIRRGDMTDKIDLWPRPTFSPSTRPPPGPASTQRRRPHQGHGGAGHPDPRRAPSQA
jgi:AcrR family transcriptional regulator